MSHEPDLQYCKTDLISSKGIVFCKFARASSALHVMESISEAGMVSQNISLTADVQHSIHASGLCLLPPYIIHVHTQGSFQLAPHCEHIKIELGTIAWSTYSNLIITCCMPSCSGMHVWMQLAGYKVKCMLAEPKSRRHSPEANSWTSEVIFPSCASCCCIALFLLCLL